MVRACGKGVAYRARLREEIERKKGRKGVDGSCGRADLVASRREGRWYTGLGVR